MQQLGPRPGAERASKLLRKPVDAATASRYHRERYRSGQEPALPAAAPAADGAPAAAGAEGDRSEIAQLQQLRDQAIRAADLATRQGDASLALRATREAMRSTADIDRLRERLEARGKAEERRRQVVLYLPERRPV